MESRPLGLAGILLVIATLAHPGPPPRLGGETPQPARPAAVGGFVAVGMQVGMEIGNRTPRADEGGFRQVVERVSQCDTKVPLVQQNKLA